MQMTLEPIILSENLRCNSVRYHDHVLKSCSYATCRHSLQYVHEERASHKDILRRLDSLLNEESRSGRGVLEMR